VTLFMIRGRQGGKSTALLEWLAAAPNRCIVTVDESRVRMLQKMILDLAVKHRWRVGQVKEMQSRIYSLHAPERRRGHRWEIGVDDAETVLAILLQANDGIGMVTATGYIGMVTATGESDR